tara:strand:- start:14839 stop:15675 length:837 start_codon:yes stop_codon:yes gene_type:complete
VQTTLYCAKDKKDNYIRGLRPPIIYLIKLNQMKKQVLKDRMYRLKSEKTPICTIINSTNSPSNPLLYFDEEKGINRAMRYAKNQKSIFEDEQDKNVVIEPIIFEDGFLSTKRSDTLLQQFLSLHPQNGVIFEEVDLERDAEDDLQNLTLEIDALKAASDLPLAKLEMIGRVLMGARVDKIKTNELKRDVLLYAREDPEGFLEMLDDSDLELEELVIKAFDQNIIAFRKQKREIYYNLKENKKRIITVPFGEDHIHSLISYFKTDDGLEVLELLEKKVK